MATKLTGKVALITGISQNLGSFEGGDSDAFGLNNLGQVVGSSTTSDGLFQAYRWQPNKGMQNLGTLGGDQSLGIEINDLGQVVGWADKESSLSPHPFLSSPATGMRDLGTLGGDRGQAYGINEFTHVVGAAWNEVNQSRVFSGIGLTAYRILAPWEATKVLLSISISWDK